ncbi:protein of unknown function [Pseudomonas asplenii]|uniref:DUF4325 domain-containing protein n=1 Tax=Pseudomonas asplenii TaxID=53407 RepID=A0A1H1WX85_9PSED|nr:STAS-like domain-containing protein [Pseudomonas asplenii]SDT01694.1 protein of unknown function [Pseudomonas asplenii]
MNVGSISVKKQFSEYPAGRYRRDGKYSGEVFRDDFVAPFLNRHDVVEIDLDGAMGYGSSFLEEAFGGLVRNHHMKPEVLRKKLKFKSNDEPSLIDEIWIYINDANA